MSIEAILWCLEGDDDGGAIPVQGDGQYVGADFVWRVLMVLAESADRFGRGACPSQPTIGRRVGCDDRRRVQKALAALREQEWIVKVAEAVPRRHGTVYDLPGVRGRASAAASDVIDSAVEPPLKERNSAVDSAVDSAVGSAVAQPHKPNPDPEPSTHTFLRVQEPSPSPVVVGVGDRDETTKKAMRTVELALDIGAARSTVRSPGGWRHTMQPAFERQVAQWKADERFGSMPMEALAALLVEGATDLDWRPGESRAHQLAQEFGMADPRSERAPPTPTPTRRCAACGLDRTTGCPLAAPYEGCAFGSIQETAP